LRPFFVITGIEADLTDDDIVRGDETAGLESGKVASRARFWKKAPQSSSFSGAVQGTSREAARRTPVDVLGQALEMAERHRDRTRRRSAERLDVLLG